MANQAVNKDKLNKDNGLFEPMKEFCREMYSLSNCLDARGAVTDRELQNEKVYLTGVQCLRHQEYPYMCSCTPFGTPELTSNREAMMDFILSPDGTRKQRPKHFPEHLLAKREGRLTGADMTGGATGSDGETGGAGATGGDSATGGGSATGGAEDKEEEVAGATGETGPSEAELNVIAPSVDQSTKRR